MNRLALKCGLGAVAGVVSATPFLAGAAYQSAQTRKDDRKWPGLGERIDVDGRLVHVRRTGPGEDGPTVLFESGLSSPLEMWGWIQPAVAESVPTLAYDRAGIGWSRPGPKPRTAGRIADELERLLDVLGVTGKLVLVGHSYGGMLLRGFAQRHPERVAGVVLVDAAHPEQLERSARQRLGLPVMRHSVQSSLFWARYGRTRWRGAHPESELSGLPEREWRTAAARMLSTTNWQASKDEIDAWLSHAVAELRDTALPADVPLYVLTAGDTENADPVHGELQRELATLSSAGVHQVVPGATHLGLLCAPVAARTVAAAVLEVVDAARSGRAPKTVEVSTTGSEL